MTITHSDTRGAAQARNHAPACRYCGRAIPATPFAREEDRFCCEACFLKQREQHDLAEERDRAYLALAEALAVEAFSAEEKTLREMVAIKCGMAPIAMGGRLKTD
ncbi:MAG: hypothetical protein ACYCY5_07300 [Sulfuricella sp.]